MSQISITLLQLLLAVIRRSQIGEKVQQNLLAKSSSSVAGSKIFGKFSDIQFHIFIAKSCFVLPIARSQLLLVGHLQNICQIFSFTYLFIMFCTIANYMKPAVIDGTFANNFSDMGTSHRGGSALLSWRIQYRKRSNQTVCFSRAGDFLTCYTLTMLSPKPKQKSFFYKAETFAQKKRKQQILKCSFHQEKFSFLFESE